MYSLAGYGHMVADAPRMVAYIQALWHAIQPGAVVLDLGTGTGIFSFLACRFGASWVYAIEPAEAIQVAKEIAAANQISGVQFFQQFSTNLTLPEQADVIISDLRGVLPLFQTHIPAIVDARQRLLAPGGVLIPQQDRLWLTLVEAPDLYQRHTTPWGENDYGLDMSPAQKLLANSWRKAQVRPEQLLLPPQQWATLDYRTITAEETDVSANLAWTVETPGTTHGLLAWFDADLAEGVSFSNAPGQPELIYGQAFFPLTQPINLTPGDAVSVQIQANLVGADYNWRWHTTVREQGDSARLKADFKQSTFFGKPISPARLRKGAASHVPTLNDKGRLEHFILSRMDGQRSLEEIARAVAEQFPQNYADWQKALDIVAELSRKFSR